MFTNFTFKPLPVEWSDILVCCAWWLFLFLGENPILQAFEVDQTNWTFAFTSDNQRINIIVVITPTNSALNLILSGVWNILGTFDLMSLPDFLLVKLLIWKLNVVTSEIFDSKSNSTQFDGVKFLDFIIVFSHFIFEWPCNQPQSIYWFIFLSFSSNCVIEIITIYSNNKLKLVNWFLRKLSKILTLIFL